MTTMYLDNKVVFLAGATGMAGSSIMNHILEKYPTTRIRATYYRHTKPFIKRKRVEYVFGDFTSVENCRKLVKGCDCAIMAAANTSGSMVLTTQPWQQITDNLVMNVNMLEAFHFESIKRAIYIGSATLYQEKNGYIKESDLDLNKPPHPNYLGIGWVVRYLEKLCEFWHKESGLEVGMVRSANIFGPYARFNPITSNFIPAIIRKAVDKMDPFEVWGSLEVTRDVIYSEDFAQAIVMMMEDSDITCDVFNIGSEIETTVGDIVKWALKYADHTPASITYNRNKPTTIKYRVLDCSKAKRLLGWQPRFTIEEGIKKTTAWWMKNKGSWNK